MSGSIPNTFIKGVVYKKNRRGPRTESCGTPAAHAIQRGLMAKIGHFKAMPHTPKHDLETIKKSSVVSRVKCSLQIHLWLCSTGTNPITDSRIGCKNHGIRAKKILKACKNVGLVTFPQQDIAHPGLSGSRSQTDLELG